MFFCKINSIFRSFTLENIIMVLVKILFDNEFRQYASEILFKEEYKSRKKYVAHGNYSLYDHCFRVALLSYSYAKEKNRKVNRKALVRGCLLHDYYLYDWHHKHEGHRLHGFRHPYFSLRNAVRIFSLSKKEKNRILSHRFPLTFWIFPKSKEALLLSHFDKVSASREHKNCKKEKQKKKEKPVRNIPKNPFSESKKPA